MDFNAKIDTISLDELDSMFGGNSVPTADDLAAGKQTPVFTANADPNIPRIDNLDEYVEEPVEDEKKDDEKPEGTPAADAKADEKKDDKPADEKQDEKKDEEKKDEKSEDEVKQISSVLKTTADFLIEKGLWKDFEGREDLELTEEVYAELAAAQTQRQVDEMFSELVDSTGLYGKAIISHIKDGGNPDQIIDLFKEQKATQQVDIKSEEGQMSLIEKYYTDVVGWDKKKVDKYISGLKSEDEGLESEAKDVQSKFDKIYKEQLEEIEAERTKQAEVAQKQQREYIDNLTKTIDTFETFTDKEKKLVKDSVLKFNKKLEDGTPVNEFYMKFYEIQKNPKEYVKLIHWVMDQEGYDKKLLAKAETKAVDKSWKFVKGNTAVSKKGSVTPTEDEAKASKLDFSALFKK